MSDPKPYISSVQLNSYGYTSELSGTIGISDGTGDYTSFKLNDIELDKLKAVLANIVDERKHALAHKLSNLSVQSQITAEDRQLAIESENETARQDLDDEIPF